MEVITLQQLETLELIIDYQQIKIDLYLYHLKQLAKIESNLITFGSLSNEDQWNKEIILKKYLQ